MTRINKSANIDLIVDAGLCTMCGICAAACPTACIAMRRTRDGRLLPCIHEERCTHCGLCLSVCPGRDVPFNALADAAGLRGHNDARIGRTLQCYTGEATAAEVREHCTSGGIVSALLIQGLESGRIRCAVTARMRAECPIETESCVVTDAAGVLACAGSKYVPVALDAVRLAAQSGSPFAVVGLPCHIHALRRWAEARPAIKQKMLLIGLMCGFGKTFRVMDNAIKSVGIRSEDIASVDFRADGWPGYMRLKTKDGNMIRIPYSECYSLDYSPMRCTLCVDGAAELADISCGDAWLPEFRGREHGVSILASRTERGVEWLESAANRGVIALQKVSPGDVVRSQARMLRRKKSQFRAHSSWARLAGSGVPRYGIEFSRPGIPEYARSLVTRLRIAASRSPIGPSIIHSLRRHIRGIVRRKGASQ